MALEQLQGTTYQYQSKNSSIDFSSSIMKKAESLGITIPYNEDGTVNIATLQNKINKQKRDEDTDSISSTKTDEFVTTTSGTKDTAENAKKAESYKDTITSKFKNEAVKYQKYMNAETEDTELAKLWNEVKESEFRLTKTGTTNQTIIEGLSSFIQKLTGAVEATKDYQSTNTNADIKETAFSLETKQDIQNAKNKIEAHKAEADDNILGNNPFMKSAFETSEYEEVAV